MIEKRVPFPRPIVSLLGMCPLLLLHCGPPRALDRRVGDMVQALGANDLVDNTILWLRPWDRRDRPTFEAFPLVEDGLLMVVMVSYVGSTYDTNLVLRPPEAGRDGMTLKELSRAERSVSKWWDATEPADPYSYDG